MLGDGIVGQGGHCSARHHEDRRNVVDRLDRGIGHQRLERIENVDAAHLRHHHIEDHDGVTVRDELVQRFDTIASAVDVDEFVAFQALEEQSSDVVVVLDDEDVSVSHLGQPGIDS